MRQLCNVTYAYLTESLDRDGREEFTAKLNADPRERPIPRSRNVAGLMAFMKGQAGQAVRRG